MRSTLRWISHEATHLSGSSRDKSVTALTYSRRCSYGVIWVEAGLRRPIGH